MKAKIRIFIVFMFFMTICFYDYCTTPLTNGQFCAILCLSKSKNIKKQDTIKQKALWYRQIHREISLRGNIFMRTHISRSHKQIK